MRAGVVWRLDAGVTTAGRFTDGHIITQVCIFITTLIVSSLAVSAERQCTAIMSLGESERRSTSLVEHTDEGMLLIDPSGAVLSANSAACRMLRCTKEEINRVGTKGFVDAEDTRLAAAVEERCRTGAFRGELTLRRAERAARMASREALIAGIGTELNNPNQVIALNAEVLSRLWRHLVPVLEKHQDAAGELSTAGMSFDELKRTVPACIEGLVTASRRIDAIVGGLKELAAADHQSSSMAVHAAHRGHGGHRGDAS